MRRGEIYRTRDKVPERGDKPGFYVVVSRTFIAENEDITTVVCALLAFPVETIGSKFGGITPGTPRDP